MNRRQWLRSTTIFTGGILFSPYVNAVIRINKWLSPLPKLTKQAFGKNFVWDKGYRPRFGLIYIDYQNYLKRFIKDSGYWFMNFLK